MGSTETEIVAPEDGMVIGRTNLPLVYEGDATFHIAQYGRSVATVEKQVEQFQEDNQPELADMDGENPSEAPIT
jgi:hypothetical protein